MNDVSLTGCLLNDMQSPGKVAKSVGQMNENSRDSIFLNVRRFFVIIIIIKIFLEYLNKYYLFLDGYNN